MLDASLKAHGILQTVSCERVATSKCSLSIGDFIGGFLLLVVCLNEIMSAQNDMVVLTEHTICLGFYTVLCLRTWFKQKGKTQ